MINNNRKKLTWSKVEAIRKSFEHVDILAKRYSVNPVTIYAVIGYKTWRVKQPVTKEQMYINKLEAENKYLKELLKC